MTRADKKTLFYAAREQSNNSILPGRYRYPSFEDYEIKSKEMRKMYFLLTSNLDASEILLEDVGEYFREQYLGVAEADLEKDTWYKLQPVWLTDEESEKYEKS